MPKYLNTLMTIYLKRKYLKKLKNDNISRELNEMVYEFSLSIIELVDCIRYSITPPEGV